MENDIKVIGWREWVSLPDLDIAQIKIKVDTGLKICSLHASNIEPFEQGGESWVSFDIHPLQADVHHRVACKSPVIGKRSVRDGGVVEERYIIPVKILLGDDSWESEASLTNRENMLFRMVLGRADIENRYLIDVSSSYLLSEDKEDKLFQHGDFNL